MADPFTGAPVVDLARRLIQTDSSIDARACVGLLAAELRKAGIEPRLLVADEARPNLIARIRGRGEAPPLLMYGHADVVPATAGAWSHDPFGAAVVDGEIWGRGALDMKGGLAMLVSAFIEAGRGKEPAGDLILAVTADEEVGGANGAAWLVRDHADLFLSVRHAISEFGGYTHHVGSRRLYPIQVAQKGRCTLELTATGPAGHSSTPHDGTAIATLAAALRAIERPLPAHLTPPVRQMIAAMAGGLAPVEAGGLRAMLRPRLTDVVLRLAGAGAADLAPMLRNTAVPTSIAAGGEAENVIPGEATARLDGRTLPGHSAEELAQELRPRLPEGARLEVVAAEDPTRAATSLDLLPLLSSVLNEEDPGGHPFPTVISGMTDARHFDRLGIQTYGFLPMQLPAGLMPVLLHAVDERVPAGALVKGTAALGRLVDRYRG